MRSFNSSNRRHQEQIPGGRGADGGRRRRALGRWAGVVGRLAGGVSRYIRSLFQIDAARLTLAGSLVRYGEMYVNDGEGGDLRLAETLAREAVHIYQETGERRKAERARDLVERITSLLRTQAPPPHRDSRYVHASPAEASDQLLALQRILGAHLTSRARYDLLLFWSRCSGGWSGRPAVDPYTRLPRRQIDQALDELVAEGLIRRVDELHAAYFALTEDRALRQAVLAFGRLTNGERHHLFQLCLAGGNGEADK